MAPAAPATVLSDIREAHGGPVGQAHAGSGLTVRGWQVGGEPRAVQTLPFQVDNRKATILGPHPCRNKRASSGWMPSNLWVGAWGSALLTGIPPHPPIPMAGTTREALCAAVIQAASTCAWITGPPLPPSRPIPGRAARGGE